MKTFLFDFDGTLVDSMPNYSSAMLRIVDEYGISYGDDLIKIVTPLGLMGSAKYYVELGVPLTQEEVVALMLKYMQEGYRYHIPAKNNVEAVLRQMKKCGASLNVLTASSHASLDPCLKRLGLYDLFDNVWSCDDFFTTKADPRIYEMAAERLGVPVSEVLFLDDNLNADMTAKSAGMPVCGVYDPSSDEYTEQIKAATDYYISDFGQLLELFPAYN